MARLLPILAGASSFLGVSFLQCHREIQRITSALSRRAERQQLAPVSVVIPALEEEKTLELTLRSLNNGTYIPREIIVVDSHSRDRTAQIARSWGCRVLQVPAGEELWGMEGAPERRFVWTTGVAEARNLGAREARNGVILFTDADTVFAHETLEEMFRAVLDGARLVHPVQVVLDKPLPLATVFRFAEYGPRKPARTQMVRREDFLRVGGFKYIYREDNFFAEQIAALYGWERIVRRGLIGYLHRRTPFQDWMVHVAR
ncbi:MAG: glycosyltransferase family A protein [Candidatus Hadarchaeales archaeon]